MADPWQGRPRPLEAVPCSLCGIELPKALMTPDGGDACDDVRWYCKDARACTERWTAAGATEEPEPAPAGESQPAGGA